MMEKKKNPNTRSAAVIALQLFLAALLCIGIFAVCLHFCKGSLTLYFEVPPDATGMSIQFEPEGIVRLNESRLSEDGAELAVQLEQVSQGITEATLTWEGAEDNGLYETEFTMRLRSLPFGILTDSITWNFTGWEYLTACLSLFLLLASVIFFLASRREKKRVFFSYRATAELGLAIFFLVASFLRIDMLLTFLRGENAGTVWSLLVSTIVTAQTFMRRTAVILAGFALVVSISNLVLIQHEGLRPSNMLGIAVGILMVGGAVFGILISRSLLDFPLRNILLNVYAGLFVYMECLLTATVIHAIQAGRHEPAYDKDYVIILGCKIRPDGTLYPLIRGRVDRAVDFVHAQATATGRQAVLVPSGGNGADEPMAEAEAMADYLREKGIPSDQILVEDQSTTTRENMCFSRKLVDENNQNAKAAFSTSSYHVYRGGILASETGWDIDGMGSRTRWYFWPNAFLREFIGLLAANKVQQLAAAGIIILFSAGVTALVM